MAAYTTISDILSGNAANLAELATALESELPVAYAVEADAAGTFNHATTSWATIDTDTITVEADELLIVVSTAVCSASNATDTWIISHEVDGTHKTAAYRSVYRDAGATSDGKAGTVTHVTVWQDISGSITINLQVQAETTPSGTFYCNRNTLHSFRLKRR